MIYPKVPSPPWLVLTLLMLASLACAAGDLLARPTSTPPPTRIAAPTFTPTPDFIQGIVVITPPSQGTPGVIIIPPGVDPRSVIPIPDTPTPTVTSTPTPGGPPLEIPAGAATPTLIVVETIAVATAQ